MQISGNTGLVTGGSSDFVLALADVRATFPKLRSFIANTGRANDREALVAKVIAQCATLNFVINNAGIQRKLPLIQAEPWIETAQKIAINLRRSDPSFDVAQLALDERGAAADCKRELGARLRSHRGNAALFYD